MKKYFVGVLFGIVAFIGYCHWANADVCFLPEDKDCTQMPYRENIDCVGRDCPKPNSTPPESDDDVEQNTCDEENFCYDTEGKAVNARTPAYDSYSKNGNCWCLESSSCSSAYNSTTPKGGNWNCPKCEVAHSQYYGKYDNTQCTCNLTEKQGYEINDNTCEYKALQCTNGATTDCTVEANDECHICVSTEPQTFAGTNITDLTATECKVKTDKEPQCATIGYEYSSSAPDGCYNKEQRKCGTGYCYQTVNAPICDENRTMVNTGGDCRCECKTGYHDKNGSCVLNTCSTGTPETTGCSTGYTFTANGSFFTNTSGDTVNCGSCVEDEYCSFEEPDAYSRSLIKYASIEKVNPATNKTEACWYATGCQLANSERHYDSKDDCSLWANGYYRDKQRFTIQNGRVIDSVENINCKSNALYGKNCLDWVIAANETDNNYQCFNRQTYSTVEAPYFIHDFDVISPRYGDVHSYDALIIEGDLYGLTATNLNLGLPEKDLYYAYKDKFQKYAGITSAFNYEVIEGTDGEGLQKVKYAQGKKLDGSDILCVPLKCPQGMVPAEKIINLINDQDNTAQVSNITCVEYDGEIKNGSINEIIQGNFFCEDDGIDESGYGKKYICDYDENTGNYVIKSMEYYHYTSDAIDYTIEKSGNVCKDSGDDYRFGLPFLGEEDNVTVNSVSGGEDTGWYNGNCYKVTFDFSTKTATIKIVGDSNCRHKINSDKPDVDYFCYRYK